VEIKSSPELLKAILNNNTQAVRALLAKGAEVDSRYDNGNTVLIKAVELQNISIVQELLKYDVDVTSAGRHQKTAFFGCLWSCYLDRHDYVMKYRHHEKFNISLAKLRKRSIL